MSSADQHKSSESNANRTLDAIGLKCPLPVLKTRRALATLDAGAMLVVVADDPMAAIDIPHLVRELRDELLAASEEGGRLRFVIRKARGASG